jgi:hypothetical protein
MHLILEKIKFCVEILALEEFCFTDSCKKNKDLIVKSSARQGNVGAI